ncbi:MAG: DUF2339 domain-containing protein [Thermodesulfobacteriota bacterium]
MRCFRCKKDFSSILTQCPSCGLKIDLTNSFNDIKEALHRTKVSHSQISDWLKELEEKIYILESNVETSFTKNIRDLPDSESPDEKTQKQTVPSQTDSVYESSTKESIEPAASKYEDKYVSDTKSKNTVYTEVRFGQKWLLIIGIVTTIVGIGFFLKYAFDQNWIGPAGRVGLAYLSSVLFLGIGQYYKRGDYKTFGLYLIGGGISSLYLSTYAAFQIYHLIGYYTAFSFMVVVTASSGFLSIKNDSKWLSILGLLGGFMTPLILNTGKDNTIALMSYIAILNFGILGIAFFKRWRELNFLGFLATWLIFSIWYETSYTSAKFWETIIFVNLFFLIYAVAPFIYYFVHECSDRIGGYYITFPNTVIAFGYSFITIKAYISLQAVSVVTLTYAGLFFLMSKYLQRKHQKITEPAIVLLGQALLFLTITIPLLFSGNWITIFWAVQAVIYIWIGLRTNNGWVFKGGQILLISTIGKFVFYDYSSIFTLNLEGLYLRGGFTHLILERWITSAIVLCSIPVCIKLIKSRASSFIDTSIADIDAPKIYLGLFLILLFVVMNIETSAFFYDYAHSARFASISVLWALYAIGLMIVGVIKNIEILRKCSFGLFGLTILKVVLIDMSNVSTPFRIISFIILGLMLMGSSYLYHRYRNRILGAETEKL